MLEKELKDLAYEIETLSSHKKAMVKQNEYYYFTKSFLDKKYNSLNKKNPEDDGKE